MQDETISSDGTEQLNGSESKKTTSIGNYYVEISGDLLSKPSALCDIIESESAKATVVYCNSPSDADFLEVLLRKRGIKVRKLIGHVPQGKFLSTLEQIRSGEASVLVVTDVAAEGLRLKDFDLCIIHSTHSDPEAYLDRTGQTGGDEGCPKKIISLIGPLDITHFHYLRKIVEFSIEKIELPDATKLATGRLKNLVEDALTRGASRNEKILPLAKAILEEANREEIICYLLQNTLEVLPALTPPERGERRERESYDDSRGDSRGGRPPRPERGGRRGYDRRRGDRSGDFSNEEYPRESRSRDFQRSSGPSKKDMRIYIGHGTKHHFSEKIFMELLEQYAKSATDQLKRFSQRDYYSFADFPEELVDIIVESLQGAALSDGSTFFIKKAIGIPVPREGGPSEDAGEEIEARDAVEDLGPEPETEG